MFNMLPTFIGVLIGNIFVMFLINGTLSINFISLVLASIIVYVLYKIYPKYFTKGIK